MQLWIVLFVIAVLVGCPRTANGWGGAKKDEAAEKAAQQLQAGLKLMQDPNEMRAAMEAMKDPATKRELDKLMKDPAFAKELQKMKTDPMYKATIEGAKAAFADPEKASRIRSQVNQAGEGELSDVQLGMSELAKTAKNPKMLAETLEMLKDPEIAAEVQAMMKDPAFQAEMKKMQSNPAFKKAMANAGDEIEALAGDPARLKKLEVEIKESMK